NELLGNLGGQPLQHGTGQHGPLRSELSRLLMHGNLFTQIAAINDLLVRFDLPRFLIRGAQEVMFEEIAVFYQGTGLRALFPILAALTNPDLRVILIDEPELSLEPRLQKVLRDVLVAASTEKTIVVATHSHLFLRRDEIEANQVVVRDGAGVRVQTLTEPRE